MRFWDSSAVIPLLTEEPRSVAILRLHDDSPDAMTVWWSTPVECTAALVRAERTGRIDVAERDRGLAGLAELAAGWGEIHPTEEIRMLATRAVRVHEGLRTADAFQLAAAIVAAEGNPRVLELMTLDRRLRDAALREGFRVLG